MKSISNRKVALALSLMLALGSLAFGAPKSERQRKHFTIEGRVLHVNATTRTLLISDMWSKRLYSAQVPDGAFFTITFGQNSGNAPREFRDVHKDDRVRMRCVRAAGRLSRLDDGREVVVVSAIN